MTTSGSVSLDTVVGARSWFITTNQCQGHEGVELFLCLLQHTPRTTLLLSFELFLYLNTLSAARRAEVELLGYWLDGPGFEFHYRLVISSPKCLSGCGGYFLEVKRLEGETQNSLPSTAPLRMCGPVPPIPYMSWCHPNGLRQGEVRERRKEGR